MDINKLCCSCLTENVKNGKCMKCGFDNRGYRYPSNCLPPNTIIHNRYIIGMVQGESKNAIIYNALDTENRTPVNIRELFLKNKSYRDHTMAVFINNSDRRLLDENKKRLLEEVRVISSLGEKECTGIYKVKEYFEENNTAYAVTEQLKGITLKQRISHSCLSYDNIVKFFPGICDAIKKIHAGGTVHLGIRPDNILITSDNELKLLGFGPGNNQLAAENLIKTSSKNLFSAPEQKEICGKIGPWTDVYMLAATIFYCLTGKIAGKEREYTALLDGKLPDNAKAALLKALNSNIENRYRSIDDFWKEFSKIIKSHKKLIVIIAAAAVFTAAVVTALCLFMPYRTGDIVSDIKGNNVIKTCAGPADNEYRMSILHNEEENSLYLLEKQKDEAQVFEFVKQPKSKYKIYVSRQDGSNKKCIQYDAEADAVEIRNENDTEEQLFSLIYISDGVYQIQSYEGSVLGFELGENNNYTGRLIVSKNKEKFQEGIYTEWMISETYIK